MIKKIIYLLVVLLQFSGIILAIVLEDLSSEKMGVARYLAFKKQVFDSTLFTPFYMNIYTFILVVGAFVCLALLIIKRIGRYNLTLLFAALINIFGIIFIQFKIELQAYYFFIIGLFIVLAIQYVWIIYFFLGKKQREN